MRPCFLIDIDGTIANLDHRLHLIQQDKPAWDAFFDACDQDLPILHMVTAVKALSLGGIDIVYVTGRRDRARAATMAWLEAHGLPVGGLYMRKAGDFRPDHMLKRELLNEILADGYEPIMAFEDRKGVVTMWREAGVPCAQVAEGAF